MSTEQPQRQGGERHLALAGRSWGRPPLIENVFACLNLEQFSNTGGKIVANNNRRWGNFCLCLFLCAIRSSQAQINCIWKQIIKLTNLVLSFCTYVLTDYGKINKAGQISDTNAHSRSQ